MGLLASAADLSSQRAVADRLGKSSPYVSRLIRRTYAGDYVEAEKQVRAVFGGEEVICPLPHGGAMPLRTCIRNRRRTKPLNWQHLDHARRCPSCPNNSDIEED